MRDTREKYIRGILEIRRLCKNVRNIKSFLKGFVFLSEQFQQNIPVRDTSFLSLLLSFILKQKMPYRVRASYPLAYLKTKDAVS